MRGFDEFCHGSEQVSVDGLRGRGHVHVMQKTVNDGQDGCLGRRGAFFQDFDEEAQHVERVSGVQIVEVLDHAFGPLERLFGKGATTVQGHDGG